MEDNKKEKNNSDKDYDYVKETNATNWGINNNMNSYDITIIGGTSNQVLTTKTTWCTLNFKITGIEN